MDWEHRNIWVKKDDDWLLRVIQITPSRYTWAVIDARRDRVNGEQVAAGECRLKRRALEAAQKELSRQRQRAKVQPATTSATRERVLH